MGAFLHMLRNFTESILGMVDPLGDVIGLTVVSVVSGAIMLVVFGLVTPPEWMKRSRELMTAATYEMRLYLDSPRRVLAAQARLVFWAFAYTAAMMPAFIVLGVPFTVLLLHMEQRYGVDQLPMNEPVLVRMEMNDQATVSVKDQPGLKVTAPPLVVAGEHTGYVRVELTEPTTLQLKIDVDGKEVTKRLSADPTAAVYSPDRGSGLDLLWLFTDEPPIADPIVESIHVQYPARDQDWVPGGMPWWAYWLIVASIAAVALAKPLKVQL